MKTVYNYHPQSLEYIGETEADESPLEPGVWLYPAHSTTVTPLEAAEDKIVTFNEETKTWYYKDKPVEPVKEEIPLTYQQQRMMNYPSIGDQLDSLFKAGIFPEDMAEQIQAVKDAFPKP